VYVGYYFDTAARAEQRQTREVRCLLARHAEILATMVDGGLRRGRVGRTIQPASLALRLAGRWAGAALPRPNRAAHREQALLRSAEDVTRTMGEMKGAVMKVGQILSLMTGMVPDEMAGQLATLHANAPPMAPALVERVFREEYGERPQRFFRTFEPMPFAAASIGQVHRATLDDGTPVAVKVQYPGVREAIDHDLANVSVMLSLGGMVARGMDVSGVVEDLAEGIRAELDYRREAAWQERFSAIYAGHAFVRVPRVYPAISTGRVLIQERIEGRPFASAIDLPQEERNRVAEKVFRFAFGNFYRHQLFNGDPHPGNYLLCPDGRVAFLDYGCVAEFDHETVDRFRALIRALFDGDHERWRAATETVGILRPNAPFTTDELYEHMHWFWKPIIEHDVTFTRELAAEMVRRNAQTTGPGGAINRTLNIPRGMVFLTRINFGLSGLFTALEARADWRSIVAEYVCGDAPSTELGRQSAATSRGPAI
jgi:predicted unusual protein kinase regulating ubiquinone biosynthesis (AarF/ABC1/UbiB family)